MKLLSTALLCATATAIAEPGLFDSIGSKLIGNSIESKMKKYLPTEKISSAKRAPEKACEEYNSWISKAARGLDKVPSILMDIKMDDSGKCVQKSRTEIFNACDYVNRAKTKVEKTLSKSSVIVFDDGVCKSAVAILEAKIIGKAKSFLPPEEELAKSAMETPQKACNYYESAMNKATGAYGKIESKLQEFVKKIPLYSKVKSFSPEMAAKLSPNLGITFAADRSCKEYPTGIATKITGALKVCERYNKYSGKLKKKVSEKVPLKFPNGKCEPKTIIDYILEFIGLSNGASHTGGKASLLLCGAVSLVVFTLV